MDCPQLFFLNFSICIGRFVKHNRKGLFLVVWHAPQYVNRFVKLQFPGFLKKFPVEIHYFGKLGNKKRLAFIDPVIDAEHLVYCLENP